MTVRASYAELHQNHHQEHGATTRPDFFFVRRRRSSRHARIQQKSTTKSKTFQHKQVQSTYTATKLRKQQNQRLSTQASSKYIHGNQASKTTDPEIFQVVPGPPNKPLPTMQRILAFAYLSLVILGSSIITTSAFVVARHLSIPRSSSSFLLSSASSDTKVEQANDKSEEQEEKFDYEVPEDVVVIIKPKAMKRLRELREQQKEVDSLVLRMGVRNGGCSGLSYVMDFSTEDAIQEDDAVDEYSDERVKCVIDSKSMLYLYGLELDYSEELIGGGFKFFNPNAEDSCGCGSSFNV